MSRIVLHIGTHKTATTFIQKFLFKNRERLKREGIFYPDYRLIGKSPHYAHLGIINGFSASHPKFSRKDAERFFAKVLETSSNFDTTIISAEPLYRHIAYRERGKIPNCSELYWELRRKYISMIQELTGATEVVVTFRKQADYVESLYQEHVKATQYQRGFNKFRKEFWYHFEYLKQYNAWKDIFGHVTIHIFETLKIGNLLEKFLSPYNIDVMKLEEIEAQNQSLYVDLVLLKRIFNSSKLSNDESRHMVQFIMDGLDTSLKTTMNRRSFFSSRREKFDFQNSFSIDNQELGLSANQNLLELWKTYSEDISQDDGITYGDQIDGNILLNLLPNLSRIYPSPIEPLESISSPVLK